MRERVQAVDDLVDGLFDRLRGHRVVDRVFYGASTLGEFSLLWVMLALARALRGGVRNERAAARVLLIAPFESLFVNVGLKWLFSRTRPVSDIVHPLPFRQPVTSSFPSGHATAGFCAATLLSEDDPLAPLYFAAAGTVALSRVHTKIHHASDVFGGVLIGTALGLLGRRLMPLSSRTPAAGHHGARSTARADETKERQ